LKNAAIANSEAIVDSQESFYKWRAGSRPIDEFRKGLPRMKRMPQNCADLHGLAAE
jgi:hypothetical protein